MTQAARAATSGEQTLLRTPGDWTKSFLAIYKPNVIYTAVLSAVPALNDMVGELSYSGGSGTLANVKAEMTLWVGSTAGARDLGVCRIRKAPVSGTFYIGYTSEIDWSAAATIYLTVVDHAILSKKTALVKNNAVVMDGETVYSDQHSSFAPVPVLSCHAVGELSGGSVAFQMDASNSWVFDSTIASYLWYAPGSLSINNAASATPLITYNTAGNHPVYCTVTAANGKSATGIQFVFRFDETHKPYAVEAQAPSANYDDGGWSFNIRMFADADPTNIIEGALAVLFAEDHYGSTKQSIGQLASRENIICWGYIAEETIEWDAETSAVEFTVMGPHYWLDKININPLALQFATSTPAAWDYMTKLSVDRALWHLLHWRSNATALLNITLTGDARYAPKVEADGTLWEQLNKTAWDKIFGRVGCDRYGRLWAVIDPQCVPVASRTWASVMTLTKADWRDRVNVKRNPQRRLSRLDISGWLADTSGGVNTLFALAMGHVDAQYGKPEIIDQLLTSSQSQLNEMAGLYMGWKNNEFEFEFVLAQNNRMIDLWPNQYLDVSLAAGDTPRGIAYAGKLIPRSVTLQPDPDADCWSTELTCEAETFAAPSMNGDIILSVDNSGNITYDPLDLSIPPMPSLPVLTDFPYLYPSPTDGAAQPKIVVIASSNFGVLYTKNFDATSPTWYLMNGGLDTYQQQHIYQMVVSPDGRIMIRVEGDSGQAWGANQIWVAEAVGGMWTKILEVDATNLTLPVYCITAIGADPNNSNHFGVMVNRKWGSAATETLGDLYLGSTAGLSLAVTVPASQPVSERWGGLMWADGQIYYLSKINGGIANLGYPRLLRFSPGGAYLGCVDVTRGGGQYHYNAINPQNMDKVFNTHLGDGIETLTNRGITSSIETTFIPPVQSANQGIAVSPSGMFLMGASASGANAWRSSDGSSSWARATNIASGSDIWENCGDDKRFIFGGGINMNLTMDWGDTYVSKIGNMLTLTPLIDITCIRYIS